MLSRKYKTRKADTLTSDSSAKCVFIRFNVLKVVTHKQYYNTTHTLRIKSSEYDQHGNKPYENRNTPAVGVQS